MLIAATRKGLLRFTENQGAWRLEGSAFVGEPVSAALWDPRDGTLYAALNLGHFGAKLHRSDDRGETWHELPAPAYPKGAMAVGRDSEMNPLEKPASLSLLWTLAAGGADRPGRLWAGTIPGGLFRSDDRGESWALVESLWNEPKRKAWMGGGYDEPGIHSLLVDPRDSDHLTLGVSCGGVWNSRDAGASWTLGGQGLRAEYMPPDQARIPDTQDVHRLAQCRAEPDTIWVQHHNGIFLSRDGGANFVEIETAKPSAFGFAVAAHPEDPQTAWFAPAVKDECRVPVDSRFVVSRTRDGGASFETFDRGLPPPPAFDLVYRHGLEIDPAGERLALGSTTGGLLGRRRRRRALDAGQRPPAAGRPGALGRRRIAIRPARRAPGVRTAGTARGTAPPRSRSAGR